MFKSYICFIYLLFQHRTTHLDNYTYSITHKVSIVTPIHVVTVATHTKKKLLLLLLLYPAMAFKVHTPES